MKESSLSFCETLYLCMCKYFLCDQYTGSVAGDEFDRIAIQAKNTESIVKIIWNFVEISKIVH